MFMWRKKLLAIGVTALLCLGTVAAVGCNSPREAPRSTADPTPATTQQLAELYPLQYESLHLTRVNAKGITVGHAAAHLQEICEAPTLRDQNGDPVLDQNGNPQPLEAAFDPASKTYDINRLSDQQLEEMNLRSGCVACKTTHFNQIYEQQGAAAFGNVYNAQARAVVDGDYFDCALCHAGDPASTRIEAGLMFFSAIGASFAARLDPRIAVCAQCHNYSDYRSAIQSESDLENIDAYRYGYDIDALFEASWEDGVNFEVDETTGIADSYVLHPTAELFLGTKMQLLGVTCTDCHMPQANADETVYTNHFSAGSPLENPDAIAYCLTCHTAQGIDSADQMVAYTRESQERLAEETLNLQQRETDFKAALEAAVAARDAGDPVLDQAKELYAKVSWYEKCLVTGPNESLGSQAAMLDWRSIVKKASDACDEGMALVG